MSDILRDPVWQFVATILAVIAILVSISLYLKQRRRKMLSYEIVSRTPLLSIEEEIKGVLKILYEGEPVQQVHLIVTTIMNSGNTPILVNEYERPISLGFGEEAQILTAEIAKTQPDSLRASTSIEDDKVTLQPTLLNGGDSITLKMLVSKFDGEITVDGRIVGVKEIQESRESVVKIFGLSVIGFVMTMAGTFGTTIFSEREPLWWGSLFLMLFGLPVYALPVLRSKSLRKRLFKLSARALSRQ